MDLQSNPPLLTSYFIIFQIRHQFTIQPRLDMISLHTDSHRIPFAHIDVIFSFRLMEPSPAIGFIDSSTMMSRRCDFYLPASDRYFFLNNRTEEFASVSIIFLKQIYYENENIVLQLSSKIPSN